MRKTAEKSITSNLSALPGTMLNPFQGMRTPISGQVYVPKNLRLSKGPQGQAEKVFMKALLLGGTYGGLAFGLRYLVNAIQAKKEEQEGQKKLKTSVRAAMPVISPDPFTTDLAEEERIQNLGIDPEDLSEEDQAAMGYGASGPNFIQKMFKKAADGDEPAETKGFVSKNMADPEAYDLIIPMAAITGMALGGHWLANKIYDKRAEKARTKSTAEKLNEMSAINLERLKLIRGVQQEEEDEGLPKIAQEDGFLSSVGDRIYGYQDPEKASISGTAKAMLAMLAAASFATGAVLTKKWEDDQDENRARLKAAEKEAERLALQTRPPTLIGEIDPEIQRQLDAHINAGSLRPRTRARSLELAGPQTVQPSGLLEEQVMDPTDPLAKNIAVV